MGPDLPPSDAEKRGKGMSVFKNEDEDDDENERDDVQAAMTMYHVLWGVLLWANS